MKLLFQEEVLNEVIDRMNNLSPESKALWGKMKVSQMLAHVANALEVANGIRKPPRIFLGRILAPFIKKDYVGEKLFPKNSPTAPDFIIIDVRDFNNEKNRVKQLATQFSKGGESNCTTHPHSFFGSMTPLQWAHTQYKHIDHHFRQFGV
jgi:hypothetical protein